MFRAFRSMLRDPEAKVLAIAAIVIITIGSVFYMLVEHWTPVEAVYFCVVTLATVGYGDLHPTTELGQLFTIGYILAGVGIIAAFISELAKHRPIAGREIARAVGDDLHGFTAGSDQPGASAGGQR
jgi:voltage-gated potassium channel